MNLDCIESCPPLNPSSILLLPGETLVTLSTGCCQYLEKKCNHVDCPEEKNCPSHLVKALNLTTQGDCCPKYYCGKNIYNIYKSFFHDLFYFRDPFWQMCIYNEAYCSGNHGGEKCKFTLIPEFGPSPSNLWVSIQI